MSAQASIKIFGASDNLIEIEGTISEEFGAWGRDNDKDDGFVVGVSDGHLFRIRYWEKDGYWRITVLAKGTCKMTKTEGDEDGEYTDVVTLRGPEKDLRWVVVGDRLARPEKAKPKKGGG